MKIPAEIPGLRWVTALMGVGLLVWIAPEGDLQRVTAVALALTAVSLAHLVQRWLGGRLLSVRAWLGSTAVLGFLFGLGAGLFTLLLMALKTGLHAHGPEFSPAEIQWVWRQIPWWSATGLLGGLGLGMVTTALNPQQ